MQTLEDQFFLRKRLSAERTKVLVLLCFIVTLIILDIFNDIARGITEFELTLELLLEILILAVVSYTIFFIWKRFSSESSVRMNIEENLEDTKRRAEIWEKEARNFAQEFNSHVRQHFNAWGLSASEKDISLLLIMGKTTKEIASARFTSDRTIRNQCQSIYEKSGCKGRNELTAFFLNPLFHLNSENLVTNDSI